VEQCINEGAGEGWLNSGDAKDRVFAMLRSVTRAAPPPALVFVTASNIFEGTAKFYALPETEKAAMANQGADAHHEFAKQGFFTIVDSLTCMAQTAEWVCLCHQKHVGGLRFEGKPVIWTVPQERFNGRMKMYGPPQEEDREVMEALIRLRRRAEGQPI
jgi:hypothetical protein